MDPEQPQKTTEKDFELYKNLPNVVSAQEKLKSILSNGGDFKGAAGVIIYEMLTRRSEYVSGIEQSPGGAFEYMKKLEPQKNWYKNGLDKIGEWVDKEGKFKWESNPGWFGINTRPEVPKRESVNVKAYATIPMKEYSFIQHIPKLANKLAELARESDDIIQVKVPNTLTGFLSNNDSVVVHFKKIENKQIVLDILNEWMVENNITKSERELGRTEIAADSKGNSFSNLVSENIAQWLEENSGKYPSETLSELSVKYAIEQSQKAPTIIKANNTV